MSYRMSVIMLAMTAVGLSAPGALASSHKVGPYAKAQLHKLCAQANGVDFAGPSVWGCEARVWRIGCTHSGMTCLIELFGTLATDVTASSGSHLSQPTSVSPPPAVAPPAGGKVTDFGGIAHPNTIGR